MIQRTDARRNLIYIFLFLLLIIPLVLQGSSAVASAADSGSAFDKTYVMNDLEGSTVEGVPFDISDYPYNPAGEIEILGFVEFGYSDIAEKQSDYGLYLYIYNPALLPIAKGDGSNRIQMAVGYDEEGKGSEFDKFDLKVCSVSAGTEANRFWKLKIIDRAISGKRFIDRVDSSERRYDVSGVELFLIGDKLPKEYNISRTFRFTGFGKDYGTTEEPLIGTVQEFDSIELNVQHTSFLANISPLGNGHYNQVSSVYFAVPNEYFDNYGNLQKIKAEWYEYKLRNMLVTANQQLYNLAQSQSGYELNENYDAESQFRLFYGHNSYISQGTTQITNYEWAYNIKNSLSYGPTSASEITVNNNQNIIPLSFYSPVNNPFEIFKFLNKYKTAGDVKANEVLKAIYNYSNDLGHGYVDPTTKKISKDLFYEFIDVQRAEAGFSVGYNQKEIDFGDTFDLQNYESANLGWLNKIIEFGWWFERPNFGEEYKDVKPIYVVKDTDIIDDKQKMSKHLMINVDDIDDFKAFYNANKKDNHIVLFRFATTDYFSRAVGYNIRKDFQTFYPTVFEDETDSYVCSETVFLDFDIISLTFNREGLYRTFAVVSNPVDVVGGLSPPPDSAFMEGLENAAQSIRDFFISIGDWFKGVGDWFADNWKIIVGVVAGAIGLIVIVTILVKIFGGKGKTKVTVNMPAAPAPKPKKTKSKTKSVKRKESK